MYGYKFLNVKTLDGHYIPGTPSDSMGNLALVKLEIPDDATVVYPVDKDYYYATDFSAESLSDMDFYKMKDYVKAKKCRCSKAKIVEVIKYYSVESGPNSYLCDVLYSITCDLQPSDLIFKSMWNPDFIYKFNEYVKPDKLDEDILWECSYGIHFCRTTEDAIDYIETCGYIIMDED